MGASGRRRHVVVVTIADLPEGAGNTSRLRRLTHALADAGYAVDIWNEHALGVSPSDRLEAEGSLDGIPFDFVLGTVNRGSGFGMVGTKLRAVQRLVGRVRQRAREGRLDVLWFNNLSYYDTRPLTAVARRYGIPTVQSYEDERLEVLHAGDGSLSNWLFAQNARLADRVCPRLADAVVVISSYLKDKYERLVSDPARVHLVPTIIDCASWGCPPEPETEVPVLLYSGAFSEQDDMESLVEAMGLVAAEGLDFRAVMLGENRRSPDAVRAVQRRVGELGLNDRVRFPGFVPLAEVKQQICASNILLNLRRDGPWSRSGLSTKLSEYLASGRLVISSGVGDVPRYVTHGESALLVEPTFTTEEVAAALSRAIRDPALRRRLGQGGREVARTHFDVPVISHRLGDLLAGLGGGA